MQILTIIFYGYYILLSTERGLKWCRFEFRSIKQNMKTLKKNEILEKFGFLLLSFGLMPSNHSKSFQDNV